MTTTKVSVRTRWQWRFCIIPMTRQKLKGTYGTGFKAPTLTELFVNNPAIGQIGNPNLKPEKPRLRLRFRAAAVQRPGPLRCNVLPQRLTDLIVNQCKVVGFVFTCTNNNVGQAETHGYEAFAAAVLNDQWKVRGDYTYTSTRDLTTNLGLLRRPAHNTARRRFGRRSRASRYPQRCCM